MFAHFECVTIRLIASFGFRCFIKSTAEYSAACSGDECCKTLFGEANVIPRSLLRGGFIAKSIVFYILLFGGSFQLEAGEFEDFNVKAQAGDPRAQLVLGEMYLDGRESHKDPLKAVNWLKMAATNPDATQPSRAQSFFLLGVAYESESKIINYPEAVKWYKKAALLNHGGGQTALSRLYSSSVDGVAKNEVEALAWMYVAANSGSPGTMNNSGIKLSISTFEADLGKVGVDRAKDRCNQLIKEINEATNSGHDANQEQK